MNRDKFEQLKEKQNYIRSMERIEMMKGFSKDNDGISSMETANFSKYIDWLENRLFEAHNEIKRLRLYGVIGSDFSVAADLNIELRGTIDFSEQKIVFEKIMSKAKLK